MDTKQRFLPVGSVVVLVLALFLVPGCSEARDARDKPAKDGDDNSGSGSIVVFICLGAFLAVGGVVLLLRSTKGLKALDPGAQLHYRCVGCKKKISYSPRRIGQKAHCPNCNKPFIFPAGAPAEPKPPKRIV
jgi:hypothetical protein